ncbi:Ankyrin-2 [Colletotrichum siamense]|uniref:Ankyrin-2 n=1 Tax=Colletotrichum siamense TaxID=690259 RepID=A0A9P5EN42_COLSI|nr:Ankyrin-2 [Colletotrichum siamense]
MALLDETVDADLSRECATALLAAARRGNLHIVTEVLKRVACIEESEVGRLYANALQAAALGGHMDMVIKLFDEGADVNFRGDRQDVNGFYPLQIALQERHPDIANLLLPKSIAFLASIKASDWRHYFGDGNDHLELNFDPIPAIKKTSEKDLRSRSYPFDAAARLTDFMVGGCQDFMVDDIKSRRIFLLANGTPLKMLRTGYRCRLWERQQAPTAEESRSEWQANDWTVDRKARLSQLPKEHYTTNGHSSHSIPGIRDTSKVHGLLWIMTKSDTNTTSQPFLEPRAFFTTSEYAQEPPRASALLVPLMEELQSEWKKTFESAQGHLSKMRMSLLKARGLNSDLIQALLNDSLLWDQIEQACRKQISDLKNFQQGYWKSSTPHEPAAERILPDTQGSEESDLKTFSMEIETLQGFHESELKALKGLSQSLIQLEFNLTSIAEAQMTRSNNTSMKRLSWITFIFLPPMFVASVFGMNVDALASNPPWWWPIVVAFPTALLAFAVVFVLKRTKHVSPPLSHYLHSIAPAHPGRPAKVYILGP